MENEPKLSSTENKSETSPTSEMSDKNIVRASDETPEKSQEENPDFVNDKKKDQDSKTKTFEVSGNKDNSPEKFKFLVTIKGLENRSFMISFLQERIRETDHFVQSDNSVSDQRALERFKLYLENLISNLENVENNFRRLLELRGNEKFTSQEEENWYFDNNVTGYDRRRDKERECLNLYKIEEDDMRSDENWTIEFFRKDLLLTLEGVKEKFIKEEKRKQKQQEDEEIDESKIEDVNSLQEKIEEVVESKLKRISELFSQSPGKRFLTHAIIEGNEPSNFRSILKHGILSKKKREESGIVDDKYRLQGFQNSDSISCFTDKDDSFSIKDKVTSGVFIIDPQKGEVLTENANKKSPFLYKGEVHVKDMVDPDALLGLFINSQYASILSNVLNDRNSLFEISKLVKIVSSVDITEKNNTYNAKREIFYRKIKYFLDNNEQSPDYDFVKDVAVKYKDLLQSLFTIQLVSLIVSFATNPDKAIPVFAGYGYGWGMYSPIENEVFGDMEKKQVISFENKAEEEILNFENFCKMQNNFYIFFAGDSFTSNIYKERDVYKIFAEKYPDIALSLNEKISNADRSRSVSEGLAPFQSELYNAYKLMKMIGATDKELFS